MRDHTHNPTTTLSPSNFEFSTGSHLRAIAESIIDPFVALRAVRNVHGVLVDFELLDINFPACQYLDRDREDIVGRRLLELFPHLVVDDTFTLLADAIKTNRCFVVMLHPVRRASGVSALPVDMKGIPYEDMLSVTWRESPGVREDFGVESAGAANDVRSIELLARAMDAKDPHTASHQRRCSEIAQAIAKQMELPAEQVLGAKYGARIHDIGKLAVPSEILNKAGSLDEIEIDLIRRHATVGWGMVADFVWPWAIAEVVRHHHERIDGSGYPDGLVGDEICIEARIVAVADVYEALTSNRPYRTAFDMELANDYILDAANSSFDPDVVDALQSVLSDGFTFGTLSKIL